jgi:hypothetical protein
MQQFHLELLNQHWIGGSTDPDGEPFDVTSEGNILLEINGEDISGCALKDHWLGINQSAVALLESIFLNHFPDEENFVVPPPLFPHGCWILGTCPNRVIDFRVRHIPGGVVILDHFIVTGSGMDDRKKHYEKIVSIPNIEYARQLLAFAEKAFMFLNPDRGEDYEAEAYTTLRKEHEKLMDITRTYLTEGVMSVIFANEVNSLLKPKLVWRKALSKKPVSTDGKTKNGFLKSILWFSRNR